MKKRHPFRISKKYWAALILFTLAVFSVWWYYADTVQNNLAFDKSEKLQVVASGYAAYALAREAGAERIALSMLVPPGTEPHHFEPTPGAIIAVEKSDLFVYVSAQAEPWTTDILQGTAGVRAVAAAAVENGDDPHVWMTPYGALAMVKQIASALQKADPAHKSYYQKNVKQFEQKMKQLHEDFTKGLANCQSREIVHIGHLAFRQLADTYGLELQSLSGTSHQGEHSVRKLTGLVRRIRKKHIPAVFTEQLLSPQLAAAVAQEVRVQVLPLYTIEEVSKDDFEQGVSYEDLMRRNLEQLQKGLKCQVL
jgi:zinc transport system substrate-binding protein